MEVNEKEFVWAERFRPSKIDDVVLPSRVKAELKKYVELKEVPHLLMYSPGSGTGKSTTAIALCEELGIKPLWLNASLDTSIDEIRMKVIQYVSTVSVFGSGGFKVVVLDESERMSTQALEACAGIMETFSKNARFIFTTNSVARIPTKIQSRCTQLDFTFTADDLKMVQAHMFKRCGEILKHENVPFNPQVLAQVVKKYTPDNRHLLNELQRLYNTYGEINEAALGHMVSVDSETLISAMKDKKFNDVEKWVVENADKLTDDFYGKVYKTLKQKVQGESIPELVLLTGRYMQIHGTVPDRQLHFLMMFTELMMSLKWKA